MRNLMMFLVMLALILVGACSDNDTTEADAGLDAVVEDAAELLDVTADDAVVEDDATVEDDMIVEDDATVEDDAETED